jgi:senataxin
LEADFLLPFRFKCTKLILVGDPKQLPPCVLSDAGKNYGLSQSLYGRLFSIFDQYPDGPISMLDTQYRMHPDICRFPSAYFYSNRLLTHDSVVTRMRHFTLKPLYLYNMTSSPHSFDTARSSFNEGEARCIQAFCELLIAHFAAQSTPVSSDSKCDADDDNDDESNTTSSSGSPDDSDHEEGNDTRHLQPLPSNDPRSIEIQQRIAIITPYKAQVRLLREHLPPYIEIMTVDSSQGKEKDIVILSCVRSRGTIGFLDDMNRVNVMLTRSRNALYVFGNLTQLATQHASWKAFVDHAQMARVICDVNMIPPDVPYR